MDKPFIDKPPYRCNRDGIIRVWAYIGNDNPERGESHGASGLARRVADKLNGQYLYVDQAMLDASFPDTQKIDEQLKMLIRKSGGPDIVIGWAADEFPILTKHHTTCLVTSILPAMAKSLFNDPVYKYVVPHHLDADILQTGSDEFDAHHPNIATPITAVFTGNMYGKGGPATEKLTNMHAHMPDGTVYFCPSRHTARKHYNKLVQQFTNAVELAGRGDGINIIAPTYAGIVAGYNPYIGLVAKADHAIVLGESQSMHSECLIRGRPVYADTINDRNQALVDRGYIKKFLEHDAAQPLDSTPLEPINTTEKIADYLATSFHEAARIRAIRPNMMTDINPCQRDINSPAPL